jgi:hypothetical protein
MRSLHGDARLDTLRVMFNFACLLRSLGELDEAALLYREALAGRSAALGHAHPSTVNNVNAYATLLERLGRLDEAASVYRDNLAARPDCTTTSQMEFDLCRLLETSGARVEAVERLTQLFLKGSSGSHVILTLFRLLPVPRDEELRTSLIDALRISHDVLCHEHELSATAVVAGGRRCCDACRVNIADAYYGCTECGFDLCAPCEAVRREVILY